MRSTDPVTPGELLKEEFLERKSRIVYNSVLFTYFRP
jgi:plasmid maintenance system antidote protein VapI